MNGRRARGLRSLGNALPPNEEHYAPRRARRAIVGFGPNGPEYRMKLLPGRMNPGPRHLTKQLKKDYNGRPNKKLPVSMHPRRGW